MAKSEQEIKAGRTPIGLWWSLVAGFAAWGFDLGFSYMLEQHSCSTGHHYVLHLISALCFAIALTGFATGFVEFRRFPGTTSEEGVAISIVPTFRRFWEWRSVFPLRWWLLLARSRAGF